MLMNHSFDSFSCILTASQAPFSIDWIPVFQYLLFTVVNTPPNYLWYVGHDVLPGKAAQ